MEARHWVQCAFSEPTRHHREAKALGVGRPLWLLPERQDTLTPNTQPGSNCPVPFWENLSSEAHTKMSLINRAPLLLLPGEQSTVTIVVGITAIITFVLQMKGMGSV